MERNASCGLNSASRIAITTPLVETHTAREGTPEAFTAANARGAIRSVASECIRRAPAYRLAFAEDSAAISTTKFTKCAAPVMPN